MGKKISVLGSGSWGTALSMVLAENGHHVSLWGRNEKQMSEMQATRENKRYLPGVLLDDTIALTSSLQESITDADYILVVVPTKAMRDVLSDINKLMTATSVFIHASKGIEPETHYRISQIIEEEISEEKREGVVVLSGPSHAEEVCKKQPTTVTCSSIHMNIAEDVQDLFMNQAFRVYTNTDLIGVEIGGSLKNIIALGSGMTSGLGFGDNAKAALMTRGLAEIARLGVKLGANPLTFAGLSGLGDLIVTCTSQHSRNWRAGNMLGKGLSVEETEKELGMVVEGIRTTKAAYQLAKAVGVDMPITTELYEVLFNDKSVDEAVTRLMGRVKKREVEHLPLSSAFSHQDPLNHFEP
ncbi:NAD(P)H-dependent glycerol-3-phosphate dehydrogenase [Paenalkalicoccus suaedae]|uniref:Glycerol-3-phosphate dehydrogenase [NAD(P)+] n=1 Tax=Paenalkalicoccus suaedae TaxID=2592382 RepID=A0A859FDY5_9BACI|nr:NAD(P)H-dependent glycerol-3-phosphate dehydrogenase [Paenalkalicoccus suaedae]QKS71081.1 NAD(P)H-dependent glycerol-3-phosphate dehydrogenase [Paenalkalicoccus suaedae]